MRTWLWVSLAALALRAEDSGPVQVALERQQAGEWQTIDPRTVLKAKERVRFRLVSQVEGFLYVLNRGSDGGTEQVFPAPGSGREVKVDAGKAYLVPDGERSFAIDGPAGYDVLYFVVSPKPLGDALSGYTPPKESNLIPKCREGGLRARGGCLDDRAGLRPRKLKVDSAPSPAFTEPVVYEFRLAHQ
jgi:hypothetical protein